MSSLQGYRRLVCPSHWPTGNPSRAAHPMELPKGDPSIALCSMRRSVNCCDDTLVVASFILRARAASCSRDWYELSRTIEVCYGETVFEFKLGKRRVWRGVMFCELNIRKLLKLWM